MPVLIVWRHLNSQPYYCYWAGGGGRTPAGLAGSHPGLGQEKGLSSGVWCVSVCGDEQQGQTPDLPQHLDGIGLVSVVTGEPAYGIL